MTDHTERERKYLAYLESDRWALQRTAALARASYRCSTCGSPVDLEVHHLTYERLGEELPQDLTVLCGKCHTRLHRQENERRRHNARLDGWASKVYGEDWADLDPDSIAEEFDMWLEDRDES